MSEQSSQSIPAEDRVPVHPVLWIMVAVMVGFEVVFAAADTGWLPDWLGRSHFYYRFAFVDALFDHALGTRVLDFPVAPMDALRPHTLLTHAFLHGGWLHLALNGAAFLGLGHALVQTIGIARFLGIFALTAIAGALAFGFIAEAQGVMVGASGALFGMIAVITAWQERALRRAGLSRAPIWRRIAALVALNVFLAIGLEGMLAWEAHLGGWVAGWLMALVIRPRFGPFSQVPVDRAPDDRAAFDEAPREDLPDASRPASTLPPRS
ncbi:MAG: rhomboid family intramembrane serine protease [Paracoccaceae bacterium]|nr:rhomboid family intramembrane serine protease [Paracoccaceae bacterium]